MAKSKIFIASSERARYLAEKVRDDLNDEEYCEADIWDNLIQAKPGLATIELIEELAKDYDVAVIINVLAKDLDTDLKTRDDCIFEAGFFMATFGRNRCFLLSSGDEGKLPSDLKGIYLFKFKEPDDLTDRGQCSAAIRNLSGHIKDVVQKIRKEDPQRGIAIRPLSIDKLLQRQKREYEGGELKEDQVVVAAVQPLELGYEAAKQVRTNIDRNIRYVYFFEGNYDAADKIPQLLQLVLLANSPELNNKSDYKSRGQLVNQQKDKIIEDLKDTCYNQKLKIYFLPESLEIEYCIHNASSDKFSKQYVKHGDEFFEWQSGKPAYDFWREMRVKNDADEPKPPYAVFHGARDFQLKDPFLTYLKMGMSKYFPGIAEEVCKLCLEGPS
jgi:CAP12/Pycsar effector protein, TIR domain